MELLSGHGFSPHPLHFFFSKLTLRPSFRTSYPVVTSIPSKLPGSVQHNTWPWEMLSQYLVDTFLQPLILHSSCSSVLLSQKSAFTQPVHHSFELTCQLQFSRPPRAPQFAFATETPWGTNRRVLFATQCGSLLSDSFILYCCPLCSPRSLTLTLAPVFISYIVGIVYHWEKDWGTSGCCHGLGTRGLKSPI